MLMASWWVATQHTPRLEQSCLCCRPSERGQTLAVEHAANMLMARVGFDILRSESFQGLATAHVQRKLNELRLPDFINSIEVHCFPILSSRVIQCVMRLQMLARHDLEM